MPLSRALLLKGLGGLTAASAAAVGAYGAMHPKKFADFFKSQNQINEEQKKKAAAVNEKLKTLGLSEDDCKLETTDFTTSSDYSKECSLDKDKFQKIKFFDGEQSATSLQGWTDKNNIKLKISNKSNGGIKFLLSGHPSNLTITKSGGEQTEKVTIKKEIETEFKEESGRLVKVINQAYKTKLEGVNEKLKTLGLTDETCKFDVTERDKVLECGLDGDKLKALKFSNKQDDQNLTLTGDVGNDLKIKVEVGEGNDPSFSFTGLSQDLTLYGDKTKGKIVIKKEEKRTFKEKDGKLEKVSLNEQAVTAKLEKFNKQLSALSLPNDCRFDVAEQDKVLECGLDASQLKAIKFSNKPSTGEPTFSGSVPSDLKVKVEAKDDDEDAHFSFTALTQDLSIYGDSAKGKIVLKSSSTSPERTFKEKSGKLEKVPQNSDKTVKLGAINATLNGLDLPNKCRFDENDEDSSTECELTLDEFKAIKLTSKEDGGSLTVAADSAATKMKLKVELKNDGNQGDETIYTLSDLDKKIKFGKQDEEITLDSGKPYEFEIRDGKLGPKRLLEIKGMKAGDDKFSVSGVDCKYEGNGNKGTCTTSAGFVDLLFEKTGGKEETESITWSGKQETFNFWEYQDGYAENIKFTYKGETHTASANSSWKLESNKNYELKKDSNNNWCLKKKDPQ